MKLPMRFALIPLTGVFCAAMLPAQVLPTTLRVSSEVAPPGGVAQVKVLMTSPQPISSGTFKFDSGLDDFWGISLFCANGDVSGAALVSKGTFNLSFTSPLSTFGSSLDYPIMTVAIPVPASALPGQVYPVNLDGLASLFRDPSGNPLTLELKPGSITVGGYLTINNIVPGGGLIPKGSTVQIIGVGFNKNSKVKVNEANVDSVKYVSPTELDIKFKADTVLDGKLIRVTNSDAKAEYYSYLRSVPMNTPANAVLAATVPAFSTNTSLEFIVPPTVSPVNPQYLTALALENPTTSPVDVRLDLYSGSNRVGRTKVQVAALGRTTRELSELFGMSLPVNSYVHVVATAPLRGMGLLADQTGGTVQAFQLNAIAPGSFKP